MQHIATLLRGIQADQIGPSGGGADIGPSVEAGQVPAMSLEVEGNYFLIHHTPADTIDKIDPAGHGQGVRRYRRDGVCDRRNAGAIEIGAAALTFRPTIVHIRSPVGRNFSCAH